MKFGFFENVGNRKKEEIILIFSKQIIWKHFCFDRDTGGKEIRAQIRSTDIVRHHSSFKMRLLLIAASLALAAVGVFNEIICHCC